MKIVAGGEMVDQLHTSDLDYTIPFERIKTGRLGIECNFTKRHFSQSL
jgi:hypothetical protein